jgi:hypothetical protein
LFSCKIFRILVVGWVAAPALTDNFRRQYGLPLLSPQVFNQTKYKEEDIDLMPKVK